MGFVALLGILSGCCVGGDIPDVRKYFDRRSPMSAVLGLAYSVEVADWDYAFASLSRESQEQARSPSWLMLGVLLHEDPDFGIPVYEIITEAIRRRKLIFQDLRARRAQVDLRYLGKDSSGTPTGIDLPIHVILERPDPPADAPPARRAPRPEWRVDLIRTLTEVYGSVAPEGPEI